MEILRQDLRYALRTLAHMRGLAAAAIGTLALGIGAATTMFSVVYGALLRPPPFPDPDRLVVLFNTGTSPREGLTRLRWSRSQIAELETAATTFESLGSFSSALVSISGGGDPEQIDGEVVSPGYFRALRARPILGRTFRADEDIASTAQPIAIVSARLWKRRLGGDPSILGATVRVNDVPLTIVGVLPDDFAGLSGKSDLWIPPPMAARLTYADYLTTRQNFISVVARLKDGSSLSQANAELAAVAPRLPPNNNASARPDVLWSAAAVSLAEARIDLRLRRSALLLLGAASGLLLIACVNVASLLLARARTRRREIAVRLAIGSSRPRLIRQLLTEGLLLAAIAGALGTLAASWGVAVIARTAPDIVASGRNNYAAIATFGTPALDVGTLIFSLFATLGTTLLFALAPAVAASRTELTMTLREQERGSGRHGRALSVLVVSEIAIACLLLVGSGLLVESFARLESRRAGFDADRVLTFWVRPPASRYAPGDGPAFLERLLARVQSVPGVELAAIDRCTPFAGCARSIAFFPDRPIDPLNAPVVGRHYASPDYFRALGIPLLAGRPLADSDGAGSAPVALVNESGARRFWPGENPIGKRVWFGTTTGPFSDRAHTVEIVGVVGDVKFESVEEIDNPNGRADFYTSYRQFAYPDTMVIVKTRGAPSSLVPALRKAVGSIDPSLPIYDVLTLDERVAAAMARPRFNAAFLTAFAAAALLLAAVGVYGVLSYSISSRLREIGVRLALGADPPRLVSRLVGEGLRLAAIGAAIGLAAALGASRMLLIAIGVSPGDPGIFATAAALITAVAGLAAFLPARRASRVDPIVVLRHE